MRLTIIFNRWGILTGKKSEILKVLKFKEKEKGWGTAGSSGEKEYEAWRKENGI